jgi:hypothetical protein
MLVPAGWGTIGTAFPPERQRSRSSPRPPDVLAVGAVFARPGPPAPARPPPKNRRAATRLAAAPARTLTLLRWPFSDTRAQYCAARHPHSGVACELRVGSSFPPSSNRRTTVLLRLHQPTGAEYRVFSFCSGRRAFFVASAVSPLALPDFLRPQRHRNEGRGPQRSTDHNVPVGATGRITRRVCGSPRWWR